MIGGADLSNKLAFDSKGLDELKQSAKNNSPDALKSAAKQFEALFMNMMLKSMRQAGGQDSPFDNEQSRMYTSMLDQQFSQNMANRGMAATTWRGHVSRLIPSCRLFRKGRPRKRSTENSIR